MDIAMGIVIVEREGEGDREEEGEAQVEVKRFLNGNARYVGKFLVEKER